MHHLALTAVAAFASVVPATAPPEPSPEPPQGVVPAGTYTLQDKAADHFTLTLTVPEGWTYDAQFSAVWGFGETAYIIPLSLGPIDQNLVPVDNCAWRESETTAVETAAELAAAMGEQRGALVSAPEPVQIGEYTGVVFTAAPIPSTGCDDGNQMTFMNADLDGWWYHGDRIHDVKTFFALDFASGLGVIEVGTYAPLLPDDQRTLLEVIDSFEVAESA